MNFDRKIFSVSVSFGIAFVMKLFCVCFTAEICETSDFRISPLYSDAKTVERSVFDISVSNKMACVRLCFWKLGFMCRSFSFNKKDQMCSVYNTSLYSLTFSEKTETRSYEVVPARSQFDCYDVMMTGNKMDGIYTIISRDNSTPMSVFCEVSSHDSGWLVIQRRTNGSEDFYRTWNEYKDGFGDMENEFWLGNSLIHKLTKEGPHQLHVDLEDFDGNEVYALYDSFSLESEQDYFKLTLGSYSGNAGDCLSYHKGRNFTTYDLDLDALETGNCARSYKGGWWYGKCHASNLNGLYLSGNTTIYAKGVVWKLFTGYYYSLKRSVMKIRRRLNFVP